MTRSADYVRRHAETSTTGKWDTGGYTGDQIRAAVAAYLEGDDMPLTDDDVHRIAAAMWGFLILDDTNNQSVQAQQLLRRIRNKGESTPQDTWNVPVMDDPSGNHEPVQRIIRWIRQDTSATRTIVTPDE